MSLKPFCVGLEIRRQEPHGNFRDGGRTSGAEGQTYRELLLGHVIVSAMHVLGELKIPIQTVLVFSQLALEIGLELTDDGEVLIRVSVCVWVLDGLVDAALGELLQRGFERMSNRLVRGLEVPLALVSSLDARVREVLCSASSRSAAAGLGGRRFGHSSTRATTTATTSSTATSSTTAATASGGLSRG